MIAIIAIVAALLILRKPASTARPYVPGPSTYTDPGQSNPGQAILEGTVHPVTVQAVYNPITKENFQATGTLEPRPGDLIAYMDSSTGQETHRVPYSIPAWRAACDGDYLIRGGLEYAITKQSGTL